MGDKWKTLDPKRIALPLINEQVLTHDDYYQLCNIHIPPGERINNLVITVLPHRSGDQRNLLVIFYHCLLKAGYPDLAREVQQRGRHIFHTLLIRNLYYTTSVVISGCGWGLQSVRNAK